MHFTISDSKPYIYQFSAKLIQNLKRHDLDPMYIWVREQHSSIHPHYHFAVFVNGNKIHHPASVTEIAYNLWSYTLGIEAKGLVNYDTSVMIRRTDIHVQEQIDKAIEVLSYLAKDYSKGSIGDGVRNFGMSRLSDFV
jgi:hypothetical protein